MVNWLMCGICVCYLVPSWIYLSFQKNPSQKYLHYLQLRHWKSSWLTNGHMTLVWTCKFSRAMPCHHCFVTNSFYGQELFFICLYWRGTHILQPILACLKNLHEFANFGVKMILQTTNTDERLSPSQESHFFKLRTTSALCNEQLFSEKQMLLW